MSNLDEAWAATATARNYQRYVEEADNAAGKGLDGDDYDHNHRIRLFAYGQVQATLALAVQVERLADILAGR